MSNGHRCEMGRALLFDGLEHRRSLWRFTLLPFFLLPLIPATSVEALDLEQKFGGHLKYQVNHTDYPRDDAQTLFRGDTLTDHEIDSRLTYEVQADAIQLTLHGEGLFVAGDGVRSGGPASTLLQVTGRQSPRNHRLLDLSEELSGDRLTGAFDLDRASVGYSKDQVVIRLGRQAMSWGNGLVFHVLDVFNPFAPTEIDKDYKTGEDMAYAQYLFTDGSDSQLLIVPRRDARTDAISNDSSSYASKFHTRLAESDIDLIAAQHYDEPFFGAGLTRDLFDAVFRGDLAVVTTDDNGTKFQFLLNADRSWEFAGKNWYGFVEYFHNSLGADKNQYSTPPPALLSRIERGELYTLAKDYLASGLRLEISPLVNLLPTVIYNLGDRSAIFQARADIDLLQNVSILTGVNTAFGGRGSEFGGIPISELGNRTASAGTEWYLRIAYYF